MRPFSPEAYEKLRAHQRWYGTRREPEPPVRNHNDEYAEFYGVHRQAGETDAELDHRVLEARGRLLDSVRPVHVPFWERVAAWWRDRR